MDGRSSPLLGGVGPQGARTVAWARSAQRIVDEEIAGTATG